MVGGEGGGWRYRNTFTWGRKCVGSGREAMSEHVAENEGRGRGVKGGTFSREARECEAMVLEREAGESRSA